MTPFRDSTDAPRGFQSFDSKRAGLFTASQLERLLAGEIDRARRQRYPLACLRIGVDRLENLADYYGREARDEIGGSLQRFLTRSLRDSDFLAPLAEGGALAIVPHAPAEGLRSITGRLLSGARSLEFASGRKTVHITLSIGVAYAAPGDGERLDGLLDGAESAYLRATELGGDRSVDWDPDAELARRRREVRDREEELDAAREAAREAAEAARASAGDPGAQPARVELDPSQLLGAVRQALDEHADALDGARQESAAKAPESGGALDHLERRVSKLAGELEGYQEQLLGLLRDGAADEEGVRSVGKMEGAGAASGSTKHAMMTEIFEANLELRDALSKSAEFQSELEQNGGANRHEPRAHPPAGHRASTRHGGEH